MALRHRRKDKSDFIKKFMVYFMGFIMVGSVFGVIFFGYNQPDTNSVKYGDYLFKQKQDLWFTKVDNIEIPFHFLPHDVLDFEIDENIEVRLKELVEIDTTSDPENDLKDYIALAEHQMSFSLSSFNIYVRNGFTTESEFEKEIITCQDSTENVPVIYFKQANETKLYLQDNCIIAEAKDGYDLLKIKDWLVYRILGISDE